MLVYIYLYTHHTLSLWVCELLNYFQTHEKRILPSTKTLGIMKCHRSSDLLQGILFFSTWKSIMAYPKTRFLFTTRFMFFSTSMKYGPGGRKYMKIYQIYLWCLPRNIPTRRHNTPFPWPSRSPWPCRGTWLFSEISSAANIKLSIGIQSPNLEW